MPPKEVIHWEYWRRWAGEPRDLVRAVEVCEREVAAWPSGGGEVETEIEVKSPGSMKTYTEVKELDALSVPEWREAREVEVWVRDHVPRSESGPSRMRYARFEVTRDRIVLSVGGDSETQVLGLNAAVKQILDRGLRRPAWFKRWNIAFATSWVMLMAALLAMLVPRALGFEGFKKDGNWSGREVVVLVTSIVGPLLIGAVLAYLTPPIEIMNPGERTMLRRFGGWVVTLVLLPLVVTVLGALIA